MKKLLLFVVSLLPAAIVCPAFAGPSSISLDEAVQLSFKQNKEIKAALEQEEAARQDLRSARGMYFPKIEAEGRYVRINDPISLDVNGIRSALIASNAATAFAATGGNAAIAAAVRNSLESQLPSFDMRLQDQDYFNFSISAVQTIYAGGRIHAANSAKKAALASAERASAAAKEKITAEVTEAYFRLKLAERVAQIRKEAREGIASHDDMARKLQEHGMIPKASRMRAQVALANAEREEKKSLRDEELAAILLANLLSVEQSSFTLTTDFFMPEEPASADSYIAQAIASNSVLNSLGYVKKQLAAAHSAEKGKMFPTLAAFGKYELYKHDLTALEPEWAAGLMLKIPLFSGLSDYSSSKAIEAKRGAIGSIAENAERQIKTLVRKLHHDMLAAKEEYESLGKAEELAEENLRLNSLSFSEGMATSLEVIDAQLALSKAKTDRCRALYDYAVARAELMRSCGRY